MLVGQLERLDLTCSRFRSDSELQRANARTGVTLAISPLLAELVETALAAAETTDGRVNPTLGGPLRAAGYDRTFALVRQRDTWSFAERPVPPEQWRHVELDTEPADIADTARCRTRPRRDRQGVGDRSRCPHDRRADRLLPCSCRWVATSRSPERRPGRSESPRTTRRRSTALVPSCRSSRRWPRDVEHNRSALARPTRATHITCSIPRPVDRRHSCWRTATVAAATCVDANVAATASIVLSHAATGLARGAALPARLVGVRGEVERRRRLARRQRWSLDRRRGQREDVLVPDSRHGHRRTAAAHRVGRCSAS